MVASLLSVLAQRLCSTASCEGSLDALKTTALKRVESFCDISKLTKKKTNDGVDIYVRSTGGVPFRLAQTFVNAPVSAVADAWWAFGARAEWDALNTQQSVLEKDDGNTRLVHLVAKAKPLISARDFVFASFREQLPNGGVRFIQASADEEPSKPIAGTVRGSVHSILIAEPVAGGGTNLIYAVEIEPKGWLPTKAVELAADDVPMVIAALRDHVQGNRT